MSYFDPSEKITSEGPDGFLSVDFSKFKSIWDSVPDGVDEDGEAVMADDDFDWDESMRNLPQAPDETEDSPDWTLRQLKKIGEIKDNMICSREAARQIENDEKVPFEPPADETADDWMDEPDTVTKYKVADLWPVEGNVLFAAPAKYGKSTMVMNLLRSLLDGDPFLGEFDVEPVAEGETILYIDFEMSRNRVRSEIRAQGISREKLKQLLPRDLRGKPGAFDITNKDCRDYWVAYCRDRNVQTLILDPLAPIMGYLNVEENDNTTVNRFFQQLDEFKKEANIRDMMVVHHCGHTADWRPRGASRFNDWPDALWLCKLDGELDDDPARKFFARGRDVGDSFNGAGTVSRTDRDKILSFVHGNGTRTAENNERGVLNAWITNEYKRSGESVMQSDLKLWAAATNPEDTPDGELLRIGDDKVRGLLANMERAEIHGCNWRAPGKPKGYTPTGYTCSNPHCPDRR